MNNIDTNVVDGFGREWNRFDQSDHSPEELKEKFYAYFSIFPWENLSENSIGFDLGCGSGRWANFVAPRVGSLHCIDPSFEALAVSRKRLKGLPNCRFHLASCDDMPLPQELG